MQLKRPTLKDMRTFIIKKGRPLSGAVFLLCLVCGYSYYTHQAEAIDALAADAEARNATNHNSDYLKDAKSNRTSTDVDSSGIQLVQSLNGVIRSHPFRDPFDALDPVPDGAALSAVAGSGLVSGSKDMAGANGIIGRRTNQGGVIISPDSERNGGVVDGLRGYGGIYSRNDTAYMHSSKGITEHNGSGSLDTRTSRGAGIYNPWQDIEVRGIIGGDVPMAIIGVGNQEGTYGLGEGPCGLRIVSINDSNVVLSDGTTTRTFSVY